MPVSNEAMLITSVAASSGWYSFTFLAGLSAPSSAFTGWLVDMPSCRAPAPGANGARGVGIAPVAGVAEVPVNAASGVPSPVVDSLTLASWPEAARTS